MTSLLTNAHTLKELMTVLGPAAPLPPTTPPPRRVCMRLAVHAPVTFSGLAATALQPLNSLSSAHGLFFFPSGVNVLTEPATPGKRLVFRVKLIAARTQCQLHKQVTLFMNKHIAHGRLVYTLFHAQGSIIKRIMGIGSSKPENHGGRRGSNNSVTEGE